MKSGLPTPSIYVPTAPSAVGAVGTVVQTGSQQFFITGVAVSPLIIREGYVVKYNPTTRLADWVAEFLTREDFAKPSDQQVSRNHSDFKEEPLCPSHHRLTLSHFSGSSFDRGHLAPAANHQKSQQSMNDTFFLSNIVPQSGVCNRQLVNDLERRIRKFFVSHQEFDELIIYSGPLTLPLSDSERLSIASQVFLKPKSLPSGINGVAADGSPLATLAGAVPVPSHFFKVALFRSSSNKAKSALAAFLIPNYAPPAPNGKGTTITAQQMVIPLHALEALCGMTFFPTMRVKDAGAFLDVATLKEHALLSKGLVQPIEAKL